MPPRSPACAFKGAGHEHDRRPAKTSRRHRQRHGRHAHGRGTSGPRRGAPLSHHRVRRRAACATTTASCSPACWRATRASTTSSSIRRTGTTTTASGCIAGDPVARIDRGSKTVTAASGRTIPYDCLLLATGSRPLAPPIPGLGLPGVCAFRDIADVGKMLEAARIHKRAVVIGGGLLGLEAAWGLKQQGMSVALVHLMPTLMERQLDAAAGQLLQRDLDRRGIAFFTNGQTEEILGTDHAEGVQLADGRTIPADLVVLAIGIRPNIDLARAAGPRRQPRRQGVRRHAHQRPGYLRGRRMRGAPRPGVRPGGAAVGSGQGLRRPARRRRDGGVRPARAVDQPENHRRRCIFGRRADGGGRGRRRDHAAR